MKRKNIVLFTNCVCVIGTHIGCTCASAYPVVYLKLHVAYAMLCMHLISVLISRKLIECFRHELSLFVNDISSKADKI